MDQPTRQKERKKNAFFLLLDSTKAEGKKETAQRRTRLWSGGSSDLRASRPAGPAGGGMAGNSLYIYKYIYINKKKVYYLSVYLIFFCYKEKQWKKRGYDMIFTYHRAPAAAFPSQWILTIQKGSQINPRTIIQCRRKTNVPKREGRGRGNDFGFRFFFRSSKTPTKKRKNRENVTTATTTTRICWCCRRLYKQGHSIIHLTRPAFLSPSPTVCYRHHSRNNDNTQGGKDNASKETQKEKKEEEKEKEKESEEGRKETERTNATENPELITIY